MPESARVGDMVSGHDNCGPVTIISGAATLMIGGQSAARVGDMAATHGCKDHSPHPPIIVGGSGTAMGAGAALARVGDATNCGSTIISGYGTTIIGG